MKLWYASTALALLATGLSFHPQVLAATNFSLVKDYSGKSFFDEWIFDEFPYDETTGGTV